MKRTSYFISIIITAFAIFNISGQNVSAATSMMVSFPETTSSAAQSKTVTLPANAVISSVTTDNGTVTYTKSGNNVTVTVSGGSVTRTDTPSKTATSTSDQTANSTFTSTKAYNDGTYSGTLTATGSPTLVSGSYTASYTKNYTDTKDWTSTDQCIWNSPYMVYQTSVGSAPASTVTDNGVTITLSQTGTKQLGVTYTKYATPNMDAYRGTDSYPDEAWTGSSNVTSGATYDTAIHYMETTYSGSHTFPATDTRVWRQTYSGTVYAASVNYYAYNVTINYSLDTTGPTASNVHLENATERGFDVVLDVNDDLSGVDQVNLALWRNGNYYGMTASNHSNQGSGTKRYHVDMSSIGAGADSVYVGVHLTDNVGNATFGGDYSFKIDTNTPNLVLSQPNTSNIIRAAASDNFNGVEKLFISGPGMPRTSYSVYSKPKILALMDISSGDFFLENLKSSGYDVTVNTNVTSLSQLAGYDIIVVDDYCWGIPNNLAAILNQAYDAGYKIVTKGNDSLSNIHPITGTQSYSGDWYISQYSNNVGGASYTNGDFDNIYKYIGTQSADTDGGNLITSWASDTRPIAVKNDDLSKAMILYSINNNGGKWIHIQPIMSQPSQGDFAKRVIDELMIENTIPQADLATLHGYNGTDGANSYGVLQSDGYYRVNKKNSATGRTNNEILMSRNYTVTVGQSVTESFYFKTNGISNNFSMTFFTNNGHHTVAPIIGDLGGGVKRAYATYTVESGATYIRAIDFILGTEDWSYIDIKQAELEQTYSKDFTITQAGTYTIEAEDFFGNKSSKTIAITNILPTINAPVETGKMYIGENVTLSATGTNISSSPSQPAYRIFYTNAATPPSIGNGTTPGTGWYDSGIAGTMNLTGSTNVSQSILGSSYGGNKWTYVTLKVWVASVTNDAAWDYTQPIALGSDGVSPINYIAHYQVVKIPGSNNELILSDPDTVVDTYGPYSSSDTGALQSFNKFIDGDFVKYRLEFDVADPTTLTDLKAAFDLNLLNDDDIDLTPNKMVLKRLLGGTFTARNLTFSKESRNRYIVTLGSSAVSAIKSSGAGRYAIEYTAVLNVKPDPARSTVLSRNSAEVTVYTNNVSAPVITEPETLNRDFDIDTRISKINVLYH